LLENRMSMLGPDAVRAALTCAADGNDEPQFAMWTYCTREVQQNLFTPHGGSPAIWKTLSMPHAARDAEL